jgi:hypothetical protein
VAEELVDIGLHASGMVEQALGGFEHFVRSRKRCIGMTV